MNDIHSCLSQDALRQIARDEIVPNELQCIEDHVSGCERCRDLFAAVTADPEWTEGILPILREPRDSGPTFVETNESRDYESVLSVLGPTDDPHMLGKIKSYEVTGVIGRGGMGIVFKAFDAVLNRFVAIKMLLPHLATSGAARYRFSREGRAAAAVVDDHVLPIYGVDEWQGVPYLVTQYSSGTTLQKRIQDQGPLELKEVLRISLQTARGLAAAHAQGLVHRDVKPSNILLDGTVERALLSDFGLARAVDDASITRSGTIAGTPQFMAPEQARGESVDQRSDLFSLGAVMYAMCTGRPPFRAESSYGVLRRITDEEPRAIREINPDIPEWLCHIIARLMAKQPEDRFGSAAEVADVLGAWLAHMQQPDVNPPLERIAQPQAAAGGGERTRLVKYLMGAGFALVLLFAGVVMVLELNKGQIRILCDAEDIPIRITENEKVVRKLTVKKSGATVRITAGTYLVEIDGEIDGITVEGGTVLLKRGGVDTVKIVQAIGDREQRAWQRSELYRGPRFDTFFPDDVDGGVALDKLWNAGDRDSRSDREILETVRRGLRRTREHRTLVLGWIGNKYIWNKSPQNPDAIEVMYHAADFSRAHADLYGTRHYAVYFGLSVVQPKSPAILRTLAELGMRVDDPNDLDRIAWGASNQRQELLGYLQPFHDSDDEAVRSKAAICRRIFSGELKAFAWAAEQARVRAEQNYADQLPQFKEVLLSGSSGDRRKTLETILRERISLIMDDSFVAAFANCSTDPDPRVRNQATIIAGSRWVWEAEQQNPEAIQLMLGLSKDDDREVRYNAVYYGLSTVHTKSDKVIRRLLKMALVDRERNLFSRIQWGLRGDRDRVAKMLKEYMSGPNQEHARAAREVLRVMELLVMSGRDVAGVEAAVPPEAPSVSRTSDATAAGRAAGDLRATVDQIGTVLGAHVFERDLNKNVELREDLVRLFVRPIELHYLKHQGLDPAEEVKRRIADAGKRVAALMFVRQRVLHSHLYKQRGGRVLLTPFGPIAFDAHRQWLEECEKAGLFELLYTEHRNLLFEPLIDGLRARLTEDPDIIRQAFDPAVINDFIRKVAAGGNGLPEPAANDQSEQTGPSVDSINRQLAGLNASVHHDFAKDGLPRDRFALRGENVSKHVAAKPDGLHVNHPGTDGYSSSSVETQMRVHGNFEVTLSFEHLAFKPGDDGSGGISLTAILENDGHTHGTVHRGVLMEPLKPTWHFVQSEFVRSPRREPGIVWLGTTAEEAASGRLRLARVGETFCCLFAANDSPQFRLIHTEQVGPESLLFGGIRLITMVQSNGSTPGTTSVIWKGLTIRAEQISDWPGEDSGDPEPTGSLVDKPETGQSKLLSTPPYLRNKPSTDRKAGTPETFGGKSLDQWIAQANQGRILKDRHEAMQVLRNFGLRCDRKRTLRAFTELLSNDAPTVQSLAAAGLRKAGRPTDPMATAGLVEIFSQNFSEVRLPRGMGEVGAEFGLPMRAVSALGALGEQTHIPVLKQIVANDKNAPLLRQAAKTAIGQIESRSANGQIQPAKSDELRRQQ